MCYKYPGHNVDLNDDEDIQREIRNYVYSNKYPV